MDIQCLKEKIYYNSAIKILKNSILVKLDWYTTQQLENDIRDIINEFQILNNINNNILYFKKIIQWFIEFVGTSQQKHKQFIEYEIDDIPRIIHKILKNNFLKDKYKNLLDIKYSEFKKIQYEILNTNYILYHNTNIPQYLTTTFYDYDLFLIKSYHEFYILFGNNATGYNNKNTSWCVVNSKKVYNFWISRYKTKNMFFVLARKNWKSIVPIKTNNAYDEYGTSLIGLLVDIKHFILKSEVLRWNSVINPGIVNPGASIDHAFNDDWNMLNILTNFNVKDKCKQLFFNN